MTMQGKLTHPQTLKTHPDTTINRLFFICCCCFLKNWENYPFELCLFFFPDRATFFLILPFCYSSNPTNHRLLTVEYAEYKWQLLRHRRRQDLRSLQAFRQRRWLANPWIRRNRVNVNLNVMRPSVVVWRTTSVRRD